MGLLSFLGIGGETTSPGLAKEIMGEWMITVKEVEETVHKKFEESDLQKLADIPWPEETLRNCADSYVLFPGFRATLEDIRHEYGPGTGWNERSIYSFTSKVRPCWYLMSARNSESRGLGTFKEDLKALRSGETFPNVPEVAFLIVLLDRVRGIKLFPENVVRCRERAGSGNHAAVGWTNHGIYIAGWADWASLADTNGRMSFIRSRKPHR